MHTFTQGWAASAELATDEAGRTVIARLTLQPEGDLPEHGITSETLRLVSVPALLPRDDAPVVPGDVLMRARLDAAEHRPRTPYSDDLYAVVAAHYLSECAGGEGRGDLADRLAGRLSEALGVEVCRESARNWVRAARKRDFLAPATHGRATAVTGRRLVAALEGQA